GRVQQAGAAVGVVAEGIDRAGEAGRDRAAVVVADVELAVDVRREGAGVVHPGDGPVERLGRGGAAVDARVHTAVEEGGAGEGAGQLAVAGSGGRVDGDRLVVAGGRDRAVERLDEGQRPGGRVDAVLIEESRGLVQIPRRRAVAGTQNHQVARGEVRQEL